MADTHQEVVKVWIAPGCIVCDACETDCPEVFDVQEETCVIRPEAQKPDFTKPLTPSIITAAEGCPVDVIKYETVEVAGPEPWAGKEAQTAGAGAAKSGGGAGAGAKKAGWEPPTGPPDPKWASLLATSHTSGSRSAGGPAVSVRSPKAPAEAVRQALPAGGLFSTAPDMARFARMILRGGELDAVRYLSPAAVKQMTSRQTAPELSVHYGLGWAVEGSAAGHSGAPGTNFLLDPVVDLLTVFLVQHEGGAGATEPCMLAFRQAAAQSWRHGATAPQATT